MVEQPPVHGLQQSRGTPHPVGQGGAVEDDTLTGEDLRLPVQRKVVGELRHQHLRHGGVGGQPALDHGARAHGEPQRADCGRLRHGGWRPCRAHCRSGWEIASHGLRWIDYRDHTLQEERADVEEAVRLHATVTGTRPLGLYQGRTSPHTLAIGAAEGGFLYLADAYADELPYWQLIGDRQQLIVPYTLDANDMRFATPQGFNTGEHFYQYLKDSFDVLHREGAEGRGGMLSVGLHCRLAGRPGRAAALERFLDYVRGHGDVWVATRLDIARHWIRHHPPAGGYRPSQMGRTLFVEVFGNVFEHTPSIAERAHAAGLSAEQDSAEGLHAAMVTAMRACPPTEREVLISAHPDLAGRLALDGNLTEASTGEQASAGLDRLSPSELARFTALNASYRERFGFPFIIAVKGLEKQDILAAFERRLRLTPEAERTEALAQIERIALLRLKAIPMAVQKPL